MVSQPASTPGTELTQPDGFSNDELRSINNAEDIATLLGGQIVNAADEMGNGFSIMESEQKDRLCGVPIVLLSATVNIGDHGLFISAYVAEMNKQGQVVGKWIVNDGSMKSGMGQQVKEYIDTKGALRGLFFPNGLRRSEYTFCSTCNSVGGNHADDCKDPKSSPAATYYLDLSA